MVLDLLSLNPFKSYSLNRKKGKKRSLNLHKLLLQNDIPLAIAKIK